MQNNKIVQVVMLMLMLLLSMWAMSALLEVRDTTRNVILGIGGFVILLSALWRKIPLDAKLLFIVLLGYALGGKGFAYVSPAEPVFIGEICLALCMGGFLLRAKQWGLVDTAIHKWIWVYLIYAGIHLWVDYNQYRLVAIRDSATAYYAFFFIASFIMFRNQLVAATFEKIIKVVLIFGIIQMMNQFSGKTFGLTLELPGFGSHADAYIQLSAAAVLFFLIRGIESKKIFYVLIGAFVAAVLCSIKTSALCALAAVIVAAILWGRVRGLLIPSIFMGAIGFVVLALATMFNPDFFAEYIASGETAETFGIEGGQFVGLSGTSSWRLDWWTNIWDNTMAMAPFWGQGFGADITGPYLEAWLGVKGDSEGYARYPHNVMFTVIGRLGLIGLFIFGALFIAIGVFSLRYCRRFFQSDDRRDADLITFGVVIAGMVNGLLQATYEVPYGALPHWVCLGYMAARYYRPQAEIDTNNT